MPADVPTMFRVECKELGATVTLVDGLITDCGVRVREGVAAHGWFDVSTLREPYRIEGKKTMGYELAEQMNWRLPDVIIYPTGGGTGLVGMADRARSVGGWIEAGPDGEDFLVNVWLPTTAGAATVPAPGAGRS